MRTKYWRPLTQFTALLLATAGLFCPELARAQTNPPPAKPETVSNRYLILVETSKAMLKRGEGTLAAVDALIKNGMQGQMHGGDTLGMWTYSDKLHLGEFPLQTWTPANKSTVARNADYFLRRQKFEKKPRVAEVLPTLQELIKDSDFITVLLFNSGSGKISGTPFDKEINTSWASWASEQEKKNMPILTVLRATRGVITHHIVVPVPWTWEMPPLPAELVAAWDAAKKEIEVATNKPPQAVGQSLIVRGKKPEAAPAPALSQPSTNKPPAQPSTTSTSQLLTNKASAPSQPIPSTIKHQPSTTSNPQLSTFKSQPPDQPSTTSAPQPAPVPATTTTQTVGTAETKAPIPPAPSQPSTLNPLSRRSQAEADQLSANKAPAPSQTSTTSNSQLSTLNSQPPNPLATTSAPQPPAPAPLTPQQGTLIPAPTIWENEWFWVGIGIATLVVVVIGISVARRPRPASKISLITSSYDRTQKP